MPAFPGSPTPRAPVRLIPGLVVMVLAARSLMSVSAGEPERAPVTIAARPQPRTSASAPETRLLRRPVSIDPGAEAPSRAWWLAPLAMSMAVLALGGLSWAARRWRLVPEPSEGRLSIVARTTLSSRHAVYMIKSGDRLLVLGTGPAGPPSLLADWPAPIEPVGTPRTRRGEGA